MKYAIDRDHRRVTVTVSAQPALEDVIAFVNGLLADPAFHRGDDIVWDRRTVTELPTRGMIETATTWLRENRVRIGFGRIALVVATASPVHYGLGRMAEILSRIEVRVFTDLDKAEAWLDRPATSDHDQL